MKSKADKILTNKYLGTIIFLVILYLIFRFVFATDLFYANFGIGTFAEGTVWSGLFYQNGHINAPGVMLSNFLNCITNWFASLVHGWLEGAGPIWQSFICNGVLAGIFSVLGFLPQILLIFFLFGFLEECGYLSRVALSMDLIFHRFGLSGRAIIPMIMGFGCSIPAMMKARELPTDKEKIQTIRVIPFFTCSAQVTLISAIAGCFSNVFGLNGSLVALGTYLGASLIAIISAIVMHLTTQRDVLFPFSDELTPMKWPSFGSLMKRVFNEAKDYIKKLFTIIFLSTIALWALLYFGVNFKPAGSLDKSFLGYFGGFISPIFTPLGWGSQLMATTEAGEKIPMGWAFSVATLNGLIARENIISTFGTLGSSMGSGSLSQDFEVVIRACGDTIGPGALLSFLSFNLLSIPCFASVLTAKRELPKGRFLLTLLFWLLTSYAISACIYTSVTFLWPIAIWGSLIIVGIVLLYLYDKKKKKEGA